VTELKHDDPIGMVQVGSTVQFFRPGQTDAGPFAALVVKVGSGVREGRMNLAWWDEDGMNWAAEDVPHRSLQMANKPYWDWPRLMLPEDLADASGISVVDPELASEVLRTGLSG
jgi:hypothetical protein